MHLLLLATLAHGAQVEIRGDVGAQIDVAPFGIFSLGWRKGPVSIEFLTDKLKHSKNNADFFDAMNQ